MNDDFQRDLLLVLGLYLFISFAMGSEEDTSEGEDDTVYPFNIPIFR